MVEEATEPPSTLHLQFIWADTFSGVYDDDWCFLMLERFDGKPFAECRCVLESGWESMVAPTINRIDITMSFDVLAMPDPQFFSNEPRDCTSRHKKTVS